MTPDSEAQYPPSLRPEARAVCAELGFPPNSGAAFAASFYNHAPEQIEYLHKAKAKGVAGTPPDAATRPARRGGLAEINITGGQLSNAIDEAECELANKDDEVYSRGEFMVRVIEDNAIPNASERGANRGPRLVEVEVTNLRDKLTKVADFRAWDERSKKTKSANCPRDVAEGLLQRKTWPSLRPIAGIITAPTMRPDGSILDKPGYDKETGILYHPTATYLPVAENPTPKDARDALDFIAKLFIEFPFVTEEREPAIGTISPARSVALALILTVLVRRALPTSPIFAINATEAGTGKSKIVQTAAVIATGCVVAATPHSLNPEEFEKSIAASLLSGEAIIPLDNLEGIIQSVLLCAATTEPVVDIRILGRSKKVKIPNTSIITMTGNALTLAGDLPRRAVTSTMDARVESPELRTFEFEDPVLRALRHRADYVNAALTVLRAYHVAGRPSNNKVLLGSFEEWTRLICGALVWLGEPDPRDTMEQAKRNDPKRAERAAVLHQWHAALGSREVSAKELIETANGHEYSEERGYDPTELAHPKLREALVQVASDNRGDINAMRLGSWIGRNKGHVMDDLRIEPGSRDNGGLAQWKVVNLKTELRP